MAKLLLLLAASCATVLAALHADTIVENLGDDDYYARRLWTVVHLLSWRGGTQCLTWPALSLALAQG
jgi:hypothetical protein